MTDLKTKKAMLSVWLIDDETDVIDRVVAGMAMQRVIGSRASPKDLQYVLIPESVVKALGLRTENTNGDTADNHLNKDHWNLTELKGLDLVRLAEEIEANAQVRFYTSDQVVSAIQRSIESEYLNFKSRTLKNVPNKVLQLLGLVNSDATSEHETTS